MQLQADNAAAVLKTLGRLKQYYGNWHSHARAVDNAYHLEWGDIRQVMALPDGVEVHIPSTAPTIVDTMRDNIVVDNYTIEVVPNGSSSQAAQKAASLSKLGQGFLDRINDSLEVPLMRQMVFDALLRGAMCAKVYVDPRPLAEEPDIKSFPDKREYLEARGEYISQVADSFPYIVRPVDPLTVFPSPGRVHPLEYAIEVQRRHVSGVQADYPQWPDPKGKKLREQDKQDEADDPTRMVEVVHVWTAPQGGEPGQYGVIADGDWVVGPTVNPYGFVPYVFSYAGLGRIDEGADPESLGVTALSKTLSELRSEVVANTTADALWQMYAFPPLFTKENAAAMKQKLSVGPGAIVTSDPESSKYLDRPEPPVEIYKHMESISRSIRLASGTEALSGNRPTGVDYGYLQALMIGQGRLKLNIVVSSVERSVGRLLGMMFKLQRNVIRKPTRVWGTPGLAEPSRIVAPDSIDNFNVKVKLDAVDPVENDRRVVLGLHPLKAGVMSRRAYLRDYRKVQDVEEEEAEILKDTLMMQAVQSGQLLPMLMQGVQMEEAIGTLADRKKQVMRDMNNRDMMRTGAQPGAGETPPDAPEMMRMEPGERGPLQSPVEGSAGGSVS